MEAKCVICDDMIGNDTGMPFGEHGKYICSNCLDGIKAVVNNIVSGRETKDMIDKRIEKSNKKVLDLTASGIKHMNDRIARLEQKIK